LTFEHHRIIANHPDAPSLLEWAAEKGVTCSSRRYPEADDGILEIDPGKPDRHRLFGGLLPGVIQGVSATNIDRFPISTAAIALTPSTFSDVAIERCSWTSTAARRWPSGGIGRRSLPLTSGPSGQENRQVGKFSKPYRLLTPVAAATFGVQEGHCVTHFHARL
jgi:hypothetical protein